MPGQPIGPGRALRVLRKRNGGVSGERSDVENGMCTRTIPSARAPLGGEGRELEAGWARRWSLKTGGQSEERHKGGSGGPLGGTENQVIGRAEARV